MPTRLQKSRIMRPRFRVPRTLWLGHGPRWRELVTTWRPSQGLPFLITRVRVRPCPTLWVLIQECRVYVTPLPPREN